MPKLKHWLSAAALMILIIVGVVACETKNVTVESTETVISGKTIRTYTIDSCEYVGYVINSNADILAHKGNCRFCIERSKQKQ
jgi:glucose uptake protein GlcU